MKVLCNCWTSPWCFWPSPVEPLSAFSFTSVSYREQGKALFWVIDFYLCFATSSKKAKKKLKKLNKIK